MKDTSEKQLQVRFSRSSQNVWGIGILEPLGHRVHREDLVDFSVVYVRCLSDLCEKFFAFLQASRNFMNIPG